MPYHNAFESSSLPQLITLAINGQILQANPAACELLGYTREIMLTLSRSDIFDINETSFKEMLVQRNEEGKSKAMVHARKPDGLLIACEISSATFIDERGTEKAITTIMDMSQHIHDQELIDKRKEKIVAENIRLAKTVQIIIDQQKDKLIAENILKAQEKSDLRFAENNEWIKYIAKASYDVMWDWDVPTGQIYVGDSVEEVFGYQLTDNLVSFQKILACIPVADRDFVEKKLSKILSSGRKIWKDNYKFTRKDGTIASTTCRASIVRNESGKAIRLIGAIQDVTRIRELEARLLEHETRITNPTDQFLQISRLSFDGIWDWNITTNEFFLGEGFERIFGYPASDGSNAFNWSDHLHPDDKETVENSLTAAIHSSDKTWEANYRFIRSDGTTAEVVGRASIVRDSTGKAIRMIGVIHDLTHHAQLEKLLTRAMADNSKIQKDYRDSFKLLMNSSSDILFDVDLHTNEVMISDAYEEEYGYKVAANKINAADWISHIHPEDKTGIIEDYNRMLQSGDTEWNCSYRFIRADKTIANVTSHRVILRDDQGNAYRMLGSMQDVSKQMVLEEKLRTEILLKESQIATAMAQAKENERSDIGKELHDNVNQLLGVSRLYLDMAKRGGKNSESFLSRSSEYTLSAIEEIRKLSKGLTTDLVKDLGLCLAIEDTLRDVMEVNDVRISSSLELNSENTLGHKFKMNIFRIVQEQLNNILKHANASNVVLRLCEEKDQITLAITDNGIGFDTRHTATGIGIENIKSRVAEFHGTFAIDSSPGNGCTMTTIFPLSATA